jgi:membrane protease YdiL (CAAX protease family)
MNRVPPAGRVALALVLGVCPWLAAWWGVYRHQSAALAFVLYHGLCFAGGFLLRSPGLPDPERLLAVRRRHLLGVVLAANVTAFVLYALVGAALLDRPLVLGLLGKQGLGPSTYVWLFPYFAFVNPLAEEFFWRGGVYATLRRAFSSAWPPTLIASVFFGAWHWLVFRLFVAPPIALAGTLVVMAVGVGLTLVYEGTRKLGYAIALHALAGDAPLLLLLFLLARGG